MSATQAMKRIPRIKFPNRHPKPAGFGSGSSPAADQKVFFKSGVTSQPETSSPASQPRSYRYRSEVPAPPSHTAGGGKASLLPKRAPVSEQEIEAILLGGCI